jgi:hypothetical protein
MSMIPVTRFCGLINNKASRFCTVQIRDSYSVIKLSCRARPGIFSKNKRHRLNFNVLIEKGPPIAIGG